MLNSSVVSYRNDATSETKIVKYVIFCEFQLMSWFLLLLHREFAGYSYIVHAIDSNEVIWNIHWMTGYT